MSEPLQPFHYAFAVDDLDAARAFYTGVLGCGEGRSSSAWIDFELFGHQIVAHLVPVSNGQSPGEKESRDKECSDVDGDHVPVPHFGVVLHWDAWHAFADRLREHKVAFVIEPRVRFEGLVGEQATMFFRDPAGNALEFKAMRHPEELFSKQEPGSQRGAARP
ncbi:MAG: VOC family protein [Planctomycetota bacterium]